MERSEALCSADTNCRSIKETYQGYACRVVYEGRVSKPIFVQTRVRQGCILLPMFLTVNDAVMRNVNRDRRSGIQWGLVDKFEDLDFADDLCLLTETTHGDMQMKLEDLINEAEKTGLIINVKKTKALRVNTNKTEPFTLRSESIEDVDSFVYLGSMVTKDRQAAQDVSQ